MTVKKLEYTVGHMSEPDPTALATPTLIRAARGAYTQSIRAELLSIGIDDLPRNGAIILAGIGTERGPRQDLSADLGVTKQAVSLAIDVLVNRGYLERSPGSGDRRRVDLELTERGQVVVDAVVRGVDEVDARLAELVPPEQIEGMRAALIALAQVKSAGVAAGNDVRPPARQLRKFSPIFPVRDLAAALAHYSALGFVTSAYEEGDEYGFADREGSGLHLAASHDHEHEHDHHHSAEAYLYVRDADALYEEWTQPGIGGSTRPVHPTPYKIREGAHIDPDGNLIRFGSFVEE